MKSLIFASSVLFSLICLASEVEFSISSNEQGSVHLVTVYGSSQSGAELLNTWHDKAESLCPGGISKIEPNSRPIVRDKACSDAIEVKDGKQQCEEIRANVFGKVICNAT
ncbi:hypothetical protein [Rheinheimera hassiensis]|uniref:hypothetical protein n=1 Tax=Rheinheimera hassiensis TaxID=1193627 RepID=UPI001F05346B|nr:hypothetical protein [Rheinheimera hassiensis]